MYYLHTWIPRVIQFVSALSGLLEAPPAQQEGPFFRGLVGFRLRVLGSGFKS